MKKFLMGFKYAFMGILEGLRTGRNQKVHAAAAVFAAAAGVYTGLSAVGYCVLALTIAAVFSAELFNSAIEALADEVCGGERREAIRRVKDMSAGAVLVTAMAAIVVAYFLFVEPVVKNLK
jgi:diacylglycerol kinase